MTEPEAPQRTAFDERVWFTRLSYAALAAAFSIVFYRMSNGHGLFDNVLPPWAQNFDQIRYWQSTEGFAKGSLSPDVHWYPPLYSLLFTPLAWLGETRAQFLVGLGLYLASFVAFARIARHFAIRPALALAMFAFGTLWLDGMQRAWAWPWNTSLSAALIMTVMAMTLDLWFGHNPDEDSKPRTVRFVLLGGMLAAIPCARPLDGLVSLILGLIAAWQLLLIRRDWHAIAAIIVGGLLVLLPYGLLYLSIWGAAPSPYAVMSAHWGFDFSKLGWKAYLLFIEPSPWYPYSAALLDSMPWLLLAGAGLLFGLVLRDFDVRLRTMIVALPLVAYLLPMIAYRAIIPSALWLYGIVHYFKWAWLLGLVLSWQFITELRRSKALGLGLLTALFVMTCFSYRPVLAGPQDPARLLVYAKARAMPDNDVYMGETALRDADGLQRNLFDLQTTPTPEGVLFVIAQNRDFSGGSERVIPDPLLPGTVRAAQGIRFDGKVSASAFGPLIARYKVQLEFGWPCWTPLYRCPQSKLPVMPLQETPQR